MCGIAGFIGKNADEKHVLDMAEALRHRGPNRRKSMRMDEACVLGHARLSIMDLSENADQPMVDAENRTAITVNGEIYNYPELKKQLEKEGAVFRTSSDSEVILHGYIIWGEKIIEMLDGMFAIGIYDKVNKKLLLARDPAGVKPLYYYADKDRFMFASEIKAFFQIPDFRPEFEPESMRTYLAYRYIPAPMTPYKNVYKLESGHTLTYADGKISVRRNWEPKFIKVKDENETAERLNAFLNENIKNHLSSDVPVGLLLSGGIDSSAVGAYMSRHMKSLNAFCCGFEEEQYDERRFARLTAETFGIKLHEAVMGQQSFLEGLAEYFEWFDEPFYDYSGLAINKLCVMARDMGIKVLLCGDGADELFAGYLWYDDFKQKSDTGAANLPETFFRYKGYFDRDMQAKLGGRKTDFDHLWLVNKYYRPELPPVNRAQILDFYTFLPDDILCKCDISGMAAGVELRVPFLNKKTLDNFFLFNESAVYRNNERKHLLKKALSSVLPPEILTNRKKGFGFPLGAWDAEIDSLCRSFLKDGMMMEYGFVCAEGLEHALRSYGTTCKWMLLSAEMWMRTKLVQAKRVQK